MSFVKGLQCRECGQDYPKEPLHVCETCFGPLEIVPPACLVSERGTAVRLKLQNTLSPLLDPGFLEGALRRHFQPLLDPSFDEFSCGTLSQRRRDLYQR